MQGYLTKAKQEHKVFHPLSVAYPVKFAPLCQERVWGGHRLKSWFSVQDSRPIGEYWLLSAHPSAVSVVENGVFKGLTLHDLTKNYPEAYLGKSPQPRFPLLVKLIEAADDLSVQVHPDDRYARKMEGDYGKTESWYILDHSPEADIIYGHRFRDREHFIRSVDQMTVKRHLKREKINKDDLVYVPAGTLHAILQGTVLLEIQQTSDVTYRVYDWDRRDEQGVSRPLHIEQAARVMQFAPPARPPICTPDSMFQNHFVTHDRLLACSYFTLERMTIAAGNTYECRLGRAGNPDVLIAVEGAGCLAYGDDGARVPFARGNALLVPAYLSTYRIVSETDVKLIRAFY